MYPCQKAKVSLRKSPSRSQCICSHERSSWSSPRHQITFVPAGLKSRDWKEEVNEICWAEQQRTGNHITLSHQTNQDVIEELTGAPAYSVLQQFAKKIDTLATPTNCFHKSSLATVDTLALVLIHLQRALPWACLDSMFGISLPSAQHCSILNSFSRHHAGSHIHLSSQPLWHIASTHLTTLLKPKVVSVADTTYIYVEKANDIDLQQITYNATYLKRPLVKVLLLTAPDGTIMLVQGPYAAGAHAHDVDNSSTCHYGGWRLASMAATKRYYYGWLWVLRLHQWPWCRESAPTVLHWRANITLLLKKQITIAPSHNFVG